MKISPPPPSKPPLMHTRRDFLFGVAAGSAGLMVSSSAAAQPTAPVSVVATPAIAALAAAIGGTEVKLTVDENAGTTVRVGDASVSVGTVVLLKGEGAARARVLDDARNAAKVALLLREQLVRARPNAATQIRDNHRALVTSLARTVFGFERRLKKSPLRGRVVRDLHGRAYLLQWAGAIIDSTSRDGGPKALAKLPGHPAAATVTAYLEHVATLVNAVT